MSTVTGVGSRRRDQRPATTFASNRLRTCRRGRVERRRNTRLDSRKIPRAAAFSLHHLARRGQRRATEVTPSAPSSSSSPPTPSSQNPPARAAAIKGRRALKFRSPKTDRLCRSRDLESSLCRASTSTDREKTPLEDYHDYLQRAERSPPAFARAAASVRESRVIRSPPRSSSIGRRA